MRSSNKILWVVALGAAVFAISGGYNNIIESASSVDVAEVQPAAGETENKAAIGGPFTLLDQNGATVEGAQFRGKHMLVFFGFTYCPDVCPTGLSTISEAAKLLTEEERAQLAALFITVDAENDTPARLKDYLSNFDPIIVGLTGSEEQLKEAQASYKVYAQKVMMDDPSMIMFNHSSFIYIMDKNGEYIAHLPHTATPQELADKLKELIAIS